MAIRGSGRKRLAGREFNYKQRLGSGDLEDAGQVEGGLKAGKEANRCRKVGRQVSSGCQADDSRWSLVGKQAGMQRLADRHMLAGR